MTATLAALLGPPSPTPAEFRARLDEALAGFVEARRPLATGISPDLGPVLDALLDFLGAGGKRLRPMLCYWGWRGAGGRDGDDVVPAAAAVELFHAFALIHDDVIDESDRRRGRPTVHHRFAALHRDSGWHGCPRQFGLSAAVLLGDIGLSWCEELFAQCGGPPPSVAAATALFRLLRTEALAGQYLDVLEQASGDGDPARAAAIVRYKTAKYTVERPLQIGAALAGGSPAMLDRLSEFGLPLGQAFQLRDDVLGVFGDPAQTGKPVGDDLRQGKQTLLVTLARHRADATQLATIRDLFGRPDLTRTGVDRLRAVLVETGALSEVESQIGRYRCDALEACRRLPVAAEARHALADIARAATDRLR
jgi:geranylgeranyl diphosphate synthase type I